MADTAADIPPARPSARRRDDLARGFPKCVEAAGAPDRAGALVQDVAPGAGR